MSCNDFLGRNLKILQPLTGYRAGVDPVLLAASVPARPGETLLDLGCGAGVAALCVGRRVPGVRLTGLELQPGYADLARRNARQNDLSFEVFTGDLADLPEELRQTRFDHVIANPPYFSRQASSAAPESGREIAMGERTPLQTWVKTAARRTAPKGTVTFIHRAERLPDLLAAAAGLLGSFEVLPLIPRRGRQARLIIFQARKGGRAAFKLHDGWLMHDGSHHDSDRESYTPATACVLRDGAPLSFS